MRHKDLIVACVFSVAIFFSFNLNGQSLNDSLRGGDLFFDTLNYDFGDIIQGPKVSRVFKFKNIGQDTLVIDHIGTMCGCTVPSWDKLKKYAPEESGEIKIEFDTNKKMGLVNSPIHIFFDNYRKKRILNLRFNILPQ